MIEKWKYVALCNYKNFGSYIKMHPFFTSTLDDNESLSMTKDGKIASHPLDSGVLSSPGLCQGQCWCHLMMGTQATSVLLLVEETQTSVTVWSTVEWTR